jgi:hypothetical protein
MAERIVKARLITWFERVPNPAIDDGSTVLTEKIAHMGDKVNIEDEAQLARLDGLDALYTDDETAEIEDGTYSGFDADTLERFRSGLLAQPAPPPGSVVSPLAESEAITGEGALDVETASAEEIGDYIRDNKLNATKTLDLLPDDADEDLLNKFLDAENHATGNSPRAKVERTVEAKLNASAEAGAE